MTSNPSRLVLVAGSGRSGTSTVAGMLKLLGLAIPQPEVKPHKTNPKGFFEPVWVVEFQKTLLRRTNSQIDDARPDAFVGGERVGASEFAVEELFPRVASWLAEAPEVVVKDPRSVYFLPLWRAAVDAAGGEIAYLTMLRHPAEVVGSKEQHYTAGMTGLKGLSARAVQTSRVAVWLNVNLFGEYHTRGSRRAFVLYSDLLQDWRSAAGRLATDLGLAMAAGLPEEGSRLVDGFIDADLRRARTTWNDIDCPGQLRDLAEETWQCLSVLATRSGGHDPEIEARLDAARAAYTELYADSAAIALSSIQRGRRQGRREIRAELAAGV